jgi:pectate lyase
MNFKSLITKILVALYCCLTYVYSQDTLSAFPEAEGFGRFAKGGRGGDVYHVTNLQDTGQGSLRYGIENASGPRTIVFDIGGTITLNSNLHIQDKGNITIAGQSAPGDGITLRKGTFVLLRAHDIIVRYIRVRYGDEMGVGGDVIKTDYVKNIIFDHISSSWGVDGNWDARFASYFTAQWCMFSEALHNSVHEKGPHAMCTSIRTIESDFTLHHNIYSTSRARHPSLGGGDVDSKEWIIDFRNNVNYNWGSTGHNMKLGHQRFNIINNYFKPGPMTGLDNKPIIVSEGCAVGYMSGNYFASPLVDGFNNDGYLAIQYHFRGPLQQECGYWSGTTREFLNFLPS